MVHGVQLQIPCQMNLAKRPSLQNTLVHTTCRKLFVSGAGGQASPAVTVSDKYHDISVLIFTSLLYRSL